MCYFLLAKRHASKTENSAREGTFTISIASMISVVTDPFPDHVNLGMLRKRLLFEVCSTVKAYGVKKSYVSKNCSSFYDPGNSGCAASEIHMSEELDNLL